MQLSDEQIGILSDMYNTLRDYGFSTEEAAEQVDLTMREMLALGRQELAAVAVA